jgi:hypothetical protein
MKIYHATSLSNLENIQEKGFIYPGSYWTINEDIHEYYLETICDEGEIPVSLFLLMEQLKFEHMSPDINGIEEPLTYTLKKSEEDVWDRWNRSKQDTQSSIKIIGSFIYNNSINVELCEIEQISVLKL